AAAAGAPGARLPAGRAAQPDDRAVPERGGARPRRSGAGGGAGARVLRAGDAGGGDRAIREARRRARPTAGGPRVPRRGVRAERRVARGLRRVPPGAPPRPRLRLAPSLPRLLGHGADLARSVSAMPALEHPAPVAGSLSRSLHAWAVAALDLVFPALCPLCSSTLAERRRDPLCGACWDAISRIAPPGCDHCGLPRKTFDPTPAEIGLPGGSLCGACRADPPGWDWGRAGAGDAGGGRA